MSCDNFSFKVFSKIVRGKCKKPLEKGGGDHHNVTPPSTFSRWLANTVYIPRGVFGKGVCIWGPKMKDMGVCVCDEVG